MYVLTVIKNILVTQYLCKYCNPHIVSVIAKLFADQRKQTPGNFQAPCTMHVLGDLKHFRCDKISAFRIPFSGSELGQQCRSSYDPKDSGFENMDSYTHACQEAADTLVSAWTSKFRWLDDFDNLKLLILVLREAYLPNGKFLGIKLMDSIDYIQIMSDGPELDILIEAKSDELAWKIVRRLKANIDRTIPPHKTLLGDFPWEISVSEKAPSIIIKILDDHTE